MSELLKQLEIQNDKNKEVLKFQELEVETLKKKIKEWDDAIRVLKKNSIHKELSKRLVYE
jgi:uncharacterized protein YigA (DUF484 family)